MVNDPTTKNAIAPLILRLALGVIFLYHGSEKVFSENNDLGASWATNLYLKQDALPTDLIAKMEKLPDEEESTITRIRNKLSVIYNTDRGPMPEALQRNAVQLAVAWGETGCGILLILGAITRVAALAMIVVQVGAILMVTFARGFSSVGGAFASGYEFNIALVAMCLALALMGGGACSVDGRLWGRRQKQQHSAPSQPVAV
jgi:uncharacterized membrane protein YphA (DoxX/SURF4 family)